MRRVRRSYPEFPPVIIEGARLSAREHENLQGHLAGPYGQEQAAACLRCPSQPCRTSGLERHRMTGDLCPVDVLETAGEDGSVRVGSGCIGCGVCAIRCPVGALSRRDDGTYVGHPTSSLVNAVTATPEDFAEWIAGATAGTSMNQGDRITFVNNAMHAAAPLLSRHFYPLVQSLFRAIGIPATVSNQGDTSNRIDLILTDKVDPIPVEVKSRTEVEAINVKSVQQALENKLAIARLTGSTNLGPASSLVVGYEYPRDRSGILELIDDIENAFGIRIGLISLRRLYESLLAVTLDGTAFDRSALASLKGAL
jgi:Fe-S-cluster-containing hydrogenase component 2